MNNNPFEYMQNFMNYDNFSKKMPNLDLSSYTEMLKNNGESLSSAQSLAYENLQSILKNSSELWQKTNTELYNNMKDAMSSGDTNQMTECQQEYLQNNIENTKKTLDMYSKSVIKVLDTLKTGKNNSKK